MFLLKSKYPDMFYYVRQFQSLFSNESMDIEIVSNRLTATIDFVLITDTWIKQLFIDMI